MTVDALSVRLNGKEYQLLSERDAQGLRRHRWYVQSLPQATRSVPRPDVRPGPIDGEYVIAWNDWSKGLCGDHENLPGCLHFAEGAHGLIPGALRPAWTEDYTGSAITTDQEWHPAVVLDWNAQSWLAMGRYVYSVNGSTITQDRDLGAGNRATDARIFNNALTVACYNPGTATSRTQQRTTGGVWSTSADSGAIYFAEVENRLWRLLGNVSVANIGPTDNPLTESSWSSAITIGATGGLAFGTALVGYGERVAACTQEGVFMGDRAAIFPNVLPQGGVQFWENGRRTITRGRDLFYPTRQGLSRYDGDRVEEVGLHQHFGTANPADQLPGLKFRSLAHDGRYLWGATEISGFPNADPTGVRFTQNNGTSYTNHTAVLTDSDLGTGATMTSWDTLANQDYLLVGYSAPFYGISVVLDTPNVNGASMAAAYVTAAGPPVTATSLPAVSALTDDTLEKAQASGGATLYYGGLITWTDRGSDLSSWVSTTVDGTDAYWMRFSVSAALSTTVTIREIRVLTSNHRAHVFRGRPWRPGDVRDSSIIWEPYTYLDGCAFPTALVVGSPTIEPRSNGGSIVALGKQRAYFLRRDIDPYNPGIMDYPGGGRVYSAKHDGGMPEVNKQWTSITIKGRTLSSDRDVQFEYRLDEASTWTVASASITSSPTTIALSGVTGRSFQWRLTFNAFTSDVFTEVNEVEVVFRPLYTYKEMYSMTFMLDMDQSNDAGGSMPSADVQLTNLEALRGSTVAQVFPALHKNTTVTVFEVGEAELYQTEHNHPALAVTVRTCEV